VLYNLYVNCLFAGKVVVQTKDVNPSTEQLYRIDYDIKECYHPEVVVARAMERLGETR